MNHSEKLRILQVVPNLERGGAERTVVDLVRWLDRSRVESAVCILQDTVPGDFSQELQHSAIPLISLNAGLGPKPGVILSLIKVMRSFQPQVVHTHLNALKYAWVAAKALGIPVIHTLHALPGTEPLVDRFANRLLFHTRGITWVAVSQTVYEMLCDSGRVEKKNLRMVHNGVDLGRFQNLASREHLRLKISLPLDTPIIISVGALRPEKNHKMLIEVAADVIRQIPDSLFLICGDGSERLLLERMIDKLGLADNVRLMGNRTDVPDLLGLSDIFVLSSTEESFSIATVEAMAAGLPIVATNVGALPEVVGESRAAILVPSGDRESLATAIIGLLKDHVRIHEISADARNRSNAFNVINTSRIYQDLYLEISGLN